MSQRLADRVAIVTGGSRGLGRAIAGGLAVEGAHVVVGYRSGEAEARQVVRHLEMKGCRALALQADTSDRESIQVMVDTTIAHYGRLDILVNNAGVMNETSFLDLTDTEWDHVINTNLRGYFMVAQICAREMVKRHYGRIINVSSTRQEQANSGSTAYCAAKGGIYMLNRVMAVELARKGICVNSIAPGTIVTDLNRHYMSNPEFREKRIASIPIGRLGMVEEVVGATVFLASEEASFCVGASLMIDGGQTLI